MGIEKFFNSLIKKDSRLNTQVLIDYKPTIQYLYIDFNSILYKVAEDIETELNGLLYELIYNSSLFSDKVKSVMKKWKYDTTIPFNKYFTENIIDNHIYEEVYDNLYHIYDNIIDNSGLKYIYVSIDGIPNMAKIVEQKRRRYMGYILGASKNYIMDKHFDSLGEKRKEFEKNKIKISRSKFFSSDPFMKKISDNLESIQNNIYKKYPSLEKYVVSGPDVPGEGEKKIMENIIELRHSGSIAIYSPDSDMIILSSILLNMVKNKSDIFVIRYDQQAKNYDTAYINMFVNNILEYIKIGNNWLIDDVNTINDIMFVFTVFGNDFVHKIESIDAKKDSDILLDIYIGTISGKSIGIIQNDQVNLQNITEYFKNLSIHEGNMMCDTYLSRIYKNYKHLKSQFIDRLWYGTLHKSLVVYFKLANIIYKYIGKWDKYSSEHIIRDIEKMEPEINVILRTYDGKKKYKFNDVINIFMVLEMDIETAENVDLVSQFITEIKKHKKISPRVRLDKFDYDVNSRYHSEKIKKFMPYSDMLVTDMDKELYEYEFMLGRYRRILNASDDGIGKCELKYFNSQYVYIYDSRILSRKKFYETYIDGDSVNNICKKYIEGMLWVHDFYYNKNDAIYNYNNVSTWFYEGHISPLVTDIHEYLKNISNSKLVDITKYLSKKMVKRAVFFDSTYHYLYITPKNSIGDNKYIVKYVNKNPDMYPNLDQYVLDIMNDIDTKNIINCGRASYITKCVLLLITYPSYEQFIIKNKE